MGPKWADLPCLAILGSVSELSTLLNRLRIDNLGYGNNVANLGSITSSTNGNVHGEASAIYSTGGTLLHVQGFVDFLTAYGGMLIRFVLSNNYTDVKDV